MAKTSTLDQEDVVRVIAPEIDFTKHRDYVSLAGPTAVTYTQISASTASNAQISFTYQPSLDQVIDRMMWVQYQLQLTFATTTDDTIPMGVGGSGGSQGLRALPLQMNCQNLQLTINGVAINNQSQYTTDCLLWMTDSDDRRLELAGAPSCPDQYYLQQGTAAGPAPIAAFAGLGPGRNAFVTWGQREVEDSRNPVNYAFTNTQAGGTPRTVWTVTVREPVMISPCVWSRMAHAGFTGISNIGVTFNILSSPLLTRFWSGAVSTGANDGQIVSVNIVAAPLPQLLLRFSERPKTLPPVPPKLSYPYFPWTVCQTTNIGAVAAYSGAGPYTSRTTTSTSIQLSQIPHRILLKIREPPGSQPSANPDVFAVLTSASVQWGTMSGILASATQRDLHALSVRNGLDMSFVGWSGGGGSLVSNALVGAGQTVNPGIGPGSILILAPGRDIPLPEGQSPGQLVSNNFQVTLNYYWPAQYAVTLELEMLVQDEGIFTIYQNTAVAQIGILSQNSVLDAPLSLAPHGALVPVGGAPGWFKGVRSFVHKVAARLGPAIRKYAESSENGPLNRYARHAVSAIDLAKSIRGELGRDFGASGEVAGGARRRHRSRSRGRR